MTGRKVITVVLAAFLLLTSIRHVYADEGDQAAAQLIIVLDCSKSMSSVDPDNQIRENIMAIAAMLPAETQVGFVAYQNEVFSFCPPTADRKVLQEAAAVMNYNGYTNAGSGLAKALSLFTEGRSRQILMISDGEVDLPDRTQLNNALTQFNDAVQEAKEKSISINILALGDKLQQGANIYGAAEVTGGKVISLNEVSALCQTVFPLLAEPGHTVLGEIYEPLEPVDIEGERIVYSFPDAAMDQISLLLVGNSSLPEMTVFSGETEVQGMQEGSVAVFQIKKPQLTDVTVQFSSAYGGDIQAMFTAEYKLNIRADTNYSQEKKCTEMAVSLINNEGEPFKLTNNNERSNLQLLVNGVAAEGEFVDGCWNIKLQGENKVMLAVKIDSGYASYHIEQPVSASIPLKDRMSLTIVYIVLAALAMLCLLLFGFYLWNRNKQKQAAEKQQQYFPQEPANTGRILPKKPAAAILPGGHTSYNGKLNIYVIRAPDEDDIPPRTLKLLGRDSKNVISLEEILGTCSIDFSLPGSKNILFYPGREKELILCSYSTATILKSQSILQEGEKYPLYYQDKITIIFEQNDVELEIHYNNIKPSER